MKVRVNISNTRCINISLVPKSTECYRDVNLILCPNISEAVTVPRLRTIVSIVSEESIARDRLRQTDRQAGRQAGKLTGRQSLEVDYYVKMCKLAFGFACKQKITRMKKMFSIISIILGEKQASLHELIYAG